MYPSTCVFWFSGKRMSFSLSDVIWKALTAFQIKYRYSTPETDSHNRLAAKICAKRMIFWLFPGCNQQIFLLYSTYIPGLPATRHGQWRLTWRETNLWRLRRIVALLGHHMSRLSSQIKDFGINSPLDCMFSLVFQIRNLYFHCCCHVN